MTAYSDLQSRLDDYANRSDLTSSQKDMFITLAEGRFNRRIIVPERETEATASASTEEIALPSGFWAMRSLYADLDPKVLIKQMSVSELRSTYATSTTGTPRHYAIENGALLLGPAPSSATDIVMNYWATIPALTSTNTSNWLTTLAPDLYLAGALTEMWIFLQDKEKAAFWDSRTEAKIEEVIKAGRRKYTGAAPLTAKGPYPAIRGVLA